MKILFVPFTPSLAHITRCLSVAGTMKAENNDCLFAVGVEGKDFIEKAGFTVSIVPEITSETFKNGRGWNWFTKKYFIDNLNAELKIIEEFNPDVIIYDFRFTSGLAARIKSKKSISIIHASALSLILNPKATASQIIAHEDLTLKKKFKEKIFQFIFPEVFIWFLRKPVKKIKPLLKQHHYTHINTVFDFLLGDLNLIADTIDFIPAGLKVPENCHIVGPLLWSGWDGDNDFPLPGAETKPIIYITMGSTIEAKSTILKLIGSIKDLPCNIIVSKGQTEFDPKELPENVFLYSRVPGNYVASISSLVIYHGGHETLMQVLSCGTPSLVIPVNPDQILVAKQIKKLGIGNYLKAANNLPMDKEPLKHFTMIEIKNEVVKVLENNQIKENCAKLKERLKKKAESKEYINFINSICQ